MRGLTQKEEQSSNQDAEDNGPEPEHGAEAVLIESTTSSRSCLLATARLPFPLSSR